MREEIIAASDIIIERLGKSDLGDPDKIMAKAAIVLMRRALLDLNRLADAMEAIARKATA